MDLGSANVEVLSDSVISIIEIATLIVLPGVISGAGLVANVINVIVFFRKGAFSTSSNMSLLALAFADIGCLLPVFCNSIACAVMRLTPATLFMTPYDYLEIATLWPHVMFVQIASWITAYIAFERCICVVFPLKVKMLFSAKRSFVVVVTIATLFGLSFIPTFATQRLEEVNDPITNTTKVMYVATKTFKEVVTFSDYINGMFIRPLAVVLVFVCTQITVYHVKRSKSWRKSTQMANTQPSDTAIKATGNTSKPTSESDSSTPHDKRLKTKSNDDDDSDKDQTRGVRPMATPSTSHSNDKEKRLVKMITSISVIFLVCNTPNVIVIVLLYTPVMGNYPTRTLFRFLLMWVGFCMESINSSINIFVYYRMSSQYRKELQAWLGRSRNKPII